MDNPIPLFYFYKSMSFKKYKANTNVSINVVLPNKENMHISFIPMSDGSSTYETNNDEIQKAIERHYNFGRLFRLASVSDKYIDVEPSDQSNEPTPSEEISTQNKVQVTDISDAKDYLADKYGVSRTALRSTTAILDKAAELGIEFVGL